MADAHTTEDNTAPDSSAAENVAIDGISVDSSAEVELAETASPEAGSPEAVAPQDNPSKENPSAESENSESENNDEYYLDTIEDIYGALRKIILMKQPVFINIEGSNENFTSAITQANLKNSSFFLDKVVPDKGNDLIRSGSRFSVLADSQGVRIEFHMTGRLKYQPANEQYRVEFPTQVLYLQRRTAYRVMIPPAHQILVKLKMEDGGDNLVGQLADLSSSGFKAVFKGDCIERLKANNRIPVARIKFNAQNNMDCSLVARHIVGTPNGNTQVGFAFNMISGMGQRFLDRLVGELQWEERQRAEQVELHKLKNNEKLPDLQG